jgi:CRP-like cAMP-binding protein
MIAIMSGTFERLFADAGLRDFAPGEALFRAGHGLRMILQRAGPGQVLAEASAWSDVYHCDAVARGPCRAAVLSRRAFRMRLKSAPDLADTWAKNLAQAVQAARLRAEIRSLPRVTDRLGAWLAEGNRLPDKGRWQEVAAELGVTREALYRELSRRRRAG